jgi:hypothetical protein
MAWNLIHRTTLYVNKSLGKVSIFEQHKPLVEGSNEVDIDNKPQCSLASKSDEADKQMRTLMWSD